MPTPDPESAPSSAGVRRTARDIRDSDIVRPARAIGDFRLGPLPGQFQRFALAGGAFDGYRFRTVGRHVGSARTPPPTARLKNRKRTEPRPLSLLHLAPKDG